MPAKKPAKPQRKFQIMVSRHQSYQFEVEAESAEKACQKLHRRLQVEDTMQTEAKQKAIFYRWSDPQEPREEWAIMRTTPSDGGDFLLLQSWDGKTFIPMGKGMAGDGIVQVMTRLVKQAAKQDRQRKKA
jgi:hypothetical protein